MKTRILFYTAFALFLSANVAMAWNHGDRMERRYDRKGDAIAYQYDVAGDRINEHYDQMALAAALNGNFAKAVMLDAKGDRIDAAMDAQGAKINHQLDVRGHKINRAIDHRVSVYRHWR